MISRIDHVSLVLCSFRHSQAFHHLHKDALVIPAVLPVIKRLRRAIFLRRIAPLEILAVDENDVAQHAPIINALTAVALGKLGSGLIKSMPEDYGCCDAYA